MPTTCAIPTCQVPFCLICVRSQSHVLGPIRTYWIQFLCLDLFQCGYSYSYLMSPYVLVHSNVFGSISVLDPIPMRHVTPYVVHYHVSSSISTLYVQSLHHASHSYMLHPYLLCQIPMFQPIFMCLVSFLCMVPLYVLDHIYALGPIPALCIPLMSGPIPRCWVHPMLSPIPVLCSLSHVQSQSSSYVQSYVSHSYTMGPMPCNRSNSNICVAFLCDRFYSYVIRPIPMCWVSLLCGVWVIGVIPMYWVPIVPDIPNSYVICLIPLLWVQFLHDTSPS